METNKNLVTVVIPCYNDSEYILEALNSVLLQTFRDYSIIIIDDGSEDETKVILNTIVDERVKVIFQKISKIILNKTY